MNREYVLRERGNSATRRRRPCLPASGVGIHKRTVPGKESSMTIVGIVILIILILLAIYLFQRVRGGGARRL